VSLPQIVAQPIHGAEYIAANVETLLLLLAADALYTLAG
jgi:hypothetical protein